MSLSVLIKAQKRSENSPEELKTAGYIPIFVSLLFTHILLFLEYVRDRWID